MKLENFRWCERWRFFEEELDFREVAKQCRPAEPATGVGWSADLGVADTAYSRWLFKEGGVPSPGGDLLESPPSLSSGARASAAAR